MAELDATMEDIDTNDAGDMLASPNINTFYFDAAGGFTYIDNHGQVNETPSANHLNNFLKSKANVGYYHDGLFDSFDTDDENQLKYLLDALWKHLKKTNQKIAVADAYKRLKTSINNNKFYEKDLENLKGNSVYYKDKPSRSGSASGSSASSGSTSAGTSSSTSPKRTPPPPKSPPSSPTKESVDKNDSLGEKDRKGVEKTAEEAMKHAKKTPSGNMEADKEAKSAPTRIDFDEVYGAALNSLRKDINELGKKKLLKKFKAYKEMNDERAFQSKDQNLYAMVNYTLDQIKRQYGLEENGEDGFMQRLKDLARHALKNREKTKFLNNAEVWDADYQFNADEFDELDAKTWGRMKTRYTVNDSDNPWKAFNIILQLWKWGKQVTYNPKLMAADYAQKYADSIQGTVVREDYNNDGLLETLIYDKRGYPKVVNGFKFEGIGDNHLKELFYSTHGTEGARRAVGNYKGWRDNVFFQKGPYNDYGKRAVTIPERSINYLQKLLDAGKITNIKKYLPKTNASYRTIYTRYFSVIWKWIKNLFPNCRRLWKCLPFAFIKEWVYGRVVLGYIWENKLTAQQRKQVHNSFNHKKNRTPIVLFNCLKKMLNDNKKKLEPIMTSKEIVDELCKQIDDSRGKIYSLIVKDLHFKQYADTPKYTDSGYDNLPINQKNEMNAIFSDLTITWSARMKRILNEENSAIVMMDDPYTEWQKSCESTLNLYNEQLKDWVAVPLKEDIVYTKAPEFMGELYDEDDNYQVNDDWVTNAYPSNAYLDEIYRPAETVSA